MHNISKMNLTINKLTDSCELELIKYNIVKCGGIKPIPNIVIYFKILSLIFIK